MATSPGLAPSALTPGAPAVASPASASPTSSAATTTRSAAAVRPPLGSTTAASPAPAPNPPTTGLREEAPSDGGWDDADTVTTFPDPATLPEPARAVPAVKAAPAPPPAASNAGLGAGMREEVWAIVRAAVEDALGPVVARQKELEARLERAEREAASRPESGSQPAAAPHGAALGMSSASSTSSSASSRLAALGPSSIPVALGPSVAPPAFTAPAPGVPRIEEATGSLSKAERVAAPVALPGPRGSIPPQGYGVAVRSAPRASLDLDAVGPVDVAGFDGGRRQKLVGRIVVALILLVFLGVVLMSILSHG